MDNEKKVEGLSAKLTKVTAAINEIERQLSKLEVAYSLIPDRTNREGRRKWKRLEEKEHRILSKLEALKAEGNEIVAKMKELGVKA